jgi:hypothetical protein
LYLAFQSNTTLCSKHALRMMIMIIIAAAPNHSDIGCHAMAACLAPASLGNTTVADKRTQDQQVRISGPRDRRALQMINASCLWYSYSTKTTTIPLLACLLDSLRVSVSVDRQRRIGKCIQVQTIGWTEHLSIRHALPSFPRHPPQFNSTMNERTEQNRGAE